MIVISSRCVLLLALSTATACNLPLFGAKKAVAPTRPVVAEALVERSKHGALLATRGAEGDPGLAVQLWGAPGGVCPQGAWRRRTAGEWVCHADFVDVREARRVLVQWRKAWPKARASAKAAPATQVVDSAWHDVFVRRRQRPRQALMVVVGDARGDTLEAARAVVKRLAGSAGLSTSFYEPRKGPHVRFLRGAPAMKLLLPLPPLAHADAPALELLARILADRSYHGRGKLQVRLQWRREGGLFEIRWPTPRVDAEAISNLVRFVSRLAESGPTVAELARARASFDAERGRQLQSPHARARRLAFYHRCGAGGLVEASFVHRLQRVTRELARDVARRLFRPSHYFLRVSHAGTATVSEAAARERLEAYSRRVAPALEAKAAVKAAKLPGGARLRVEVDGGAPWVTFRLAWRAGGSLEARNDAGISRLIAATLSREARRRHGDELRSVGGALDAVAGLDFFALRAAGPAHHWERVLELLADMALRGPTDAASFRAARRELVGRALKVEAEARFRLGQLFVRQVFGDHPYALPAEGRSSALSRISLARLQRYHRGRHSPRQLVLTVVGKVDAAQVAAKAARLLGQPHIAQPAAPPVIASLPTWRSAMRIESSPVARVVHLAVGYPAPARGRADHLLFRLLARVLRYRLQNDPALAPLSVDLRLAGGILGGALLIRVGVPVEKAQAVLEAISKEVQTLRVTISAAAAARAKHETLQHLRRTFQGQAGRAALHAMEALARSPNKKVAMDRKVIEQADATRLRAVANRYLRVEARVVVALQPAKLSPGAELRLGGGPERGAPLSGRPASRKRSR